MDDLLLESIEHYNEYVMERLKLIIDFDIWYEHTTGKAFPKEWYSIIKSRRQDGE